MNKRTNVADDSIATTTFGAVALQTPEGSNRDTSPPRAPTSAKSSLFADAMKVVVTSGQSVRDRRKLFSLRKSRSVETSGTGKTIGAVGIQVRSYIRFVDNIWLYRHCCLALMQVPSLIACAHRLIQSQRVQLEVSKCYN
jgi:hypothetical protein